MDKERKKAINQSVSLCPIWPTQAAEKVGKMISEINQADGIMRNIAATAQNNAIKGGFAAETWHAESFNLDAILKDKSVRAFTDQYNNSPLAKNHTAHDILITKGDGQSLGVQLKYYKNAEATQKAFRSTQDGIHKYQDSDVFLGPSDQLQGIKQSAQRDITKNQQTRPEVAKAAEKVRGHSTDHLDVEGTQSTRLSKKDAEQLGSGSQSGKDLHKNMQDGYLNKATVQQSLRAAGSAALFTTLIAGSINTFQYLESMRKGEISAEEAARMILQDTAIAAGDSALKAGVATASVSVAARTMPGLFTGTAFTRTFANSGIAAAAVCAVDVVQCVVLFACGKISQQELETRAGKTLFQGGAGATGAAVGAAVGAIGGPGGALVGSIVGGLISTLAMNIALDNHIEKPFQLTLAATGQLIDNARIMNDSLAQLQTAQLFYVDFCKGLYLADKHFTCQVKTLAAQSARLKEKIKKL